MWARVWAEGMSSLCSGRGRGWKTCRVYVAMAAVLSGCAAACSGAGLLSIPGQLLYGLLFEEETAALWLCISQNQLIGCSALQEARVAEVAAPVMAVPASTPPTPVATTSSPAFALSWQVTVAAPQLLGAPEAACCSVHCQCKQ